MVGSDKARFGVVLFWLAAKYPIDWSTPRKLSDADVDEYFEALKDIKIECIEWAAKYYYGRGKFFPKPADIREASVFVPSSVYVQVTGNPTLKALSESVPSRPEVVKKAMGILNAVVSGGMTMEEALKEIPLPEKKL